MVDPFNKYLQAEKFGLGSGFHEMLWPGSEKKVQQEKHWVRGSLLSTWKNISSE